MSDTQTPLPKHIESLQQNFGPEADPVYRADVARTDIVESNCGNGLIRRDYSSTPAA